MRRLITTVVLLMFGSAAMAQTAGMKSSTTPSPNSVGSGSIPEAPVGHRQPRAGDVPNEKNLSNPNDPVNKEDALLDKKIRSICRGC